MLHFFHKNGFTLRSVKLESCIFTCTFIIDRNFLPKISVITTFLHSHDNMYFRTSIKLKQLNNGDLRDLFKLLILFVFYLNVLVHVKENRRVKIQFTVPR